MEYPGERAYLIGSLNRYASVFSITPRKSRTYIQELIGDDVSRVIISDRAPQYLAWFARQLCWSHVLRPFEFLVQSHGSKAVGAELVECAGRSLERIGLIELTRSLLAHINQPLGH